MKFALAILSCFLAAGSLAIGQAVSAELVLDQDQYLAAESLPLKVRITNFSGQPLPLGADPRWLTFVVEDAHHLLVAKQGEVPVVGEFTLAPSTTGTKKVDLSPYFSLARIGRYYVRATVTVPQWGQALQTKAIPFDIIKGSSLWDQEFGVPRSTKGADGRPEVRRYSIIETLHSKTIKLYFRLTEPREDRVICVYPLGQMVSFSNPEPQIDRFSNLHVLYQSGSRTFVHCLINPDGLLIARETYQYTDRRPVLKPESDGRISVFGGLRLAAPDDLPPPDTNALSNPKLGQP